MKLKRKKIREEMHIFSRKGNPHLLWLLLFLVIMIPTNTYGAEKGTEAIASYQRIATGSDGQDYIVQGPVKNVLYDSQGNKTYSDWNPNLHIRMFTLKESSDTTNIGYCVQWGRELEDYSTYYAQEESPSLLNSILPTEVYEEMVLATTYGYAPGKQPIFPECNDEDWFVATQIVLWEYQQGLRTSPDHLADRSGMKKDYFQKAILGRPAEKYYQYILEKIRNHRKKPDFIDGSEKILRYQPETNDYRLTLKDENFDFIPFQIESKSIDVLPEENGITLVARESLDSQSITFTHKKNGFEEPRLIWKDGKDGQKLITGYVNDYVFAFNARTEKDGLLELIKTSENNKVEGIEFTITPKGGTSFTETTDEKGRINLFLMPGTYTIEENPSSAYVKQPAQEVTIEEGTLHTVKFHNVLKKGTVIITKVDKNTGKSLPGCGLEILNENKEVLFQAQTDKEGKVSFENLPLGKYFFREYQSPKGYQKDSSLHPFEIKENEQTLELKMENQEIIKTPKPEKTPITGDQTPSLILLWAFLFIGTGIFLLRFLLRKI